MINKDKLKEKYHEKFRKNINKNKSYFEQLAERARKEYDNHPSFYAVANGRSITQQEREELKALIELIKLYESRFELEQVKYSSC